MQRLKTRAQFQATMSAGTIARTPHFALHRMVLTPQPSAEQVAATASTGPGSEDPQALFDVGAQRAQAWIGAMVPKRWARRAVTRHAIKRQILAVASEHEVGLACASHVVRLRSAFDRQQFASATSTALKQAVRAELQQLFADALRRIARADQASNAAQGIGAKARKAGHPVASAQEGAA